MPGVFERNKTAAEFLKGLVTKGDTSLTKTDWKKVVGVGFFVLLPKNSWLRKLVESDERDAGRRPPSR